MDSQRIMDQSKAAYGQWAPQWREHCKINSKIPMKNLENYQATGIGKAALCVANGYSLELEIETIKKYQNNVDIFACDKTIGSLLDHGVVPDFCIICDANVDYETYLEPWKDKLKDTVAIMNVCGNPKWVHGIEWKDVYFFVNKDILKSEHEFSALSGCKNIVPAGTNVSNAMVILLTQSDNEGKRNFFGYDKILLIGFDYCWIYGGNYYAFDKTGGGKSNYMRHIHCQTADCDWAYTSGNLAFSAEWLTKYVKTFDLPIVQCTKKTILSSLRFGVLEEQMQYKGQTEDSLGVRKIVAELQKLVKRQSEIQKYLVDVERRHALSFLQTV